MGIASPAPAIAAAPKEKLNMVLRTEEAAPNSVPLMWRVGLVMALAMEERSSSRVTAADGTFVVGQNEPAQVLQEENVLANCSIAWASAQALDEGVEEGAVDGEVVDGELVADGVAVDEGVVEEVVEEEVVLDEVVLDEAVVEEVVVDGVVLAEVVDKDVVVI